ncbi:putative nicotinate-nucleotide adenylyltransferase [Devosia pacifica]|uniref:Probable nicotinate-nucleotide adenylyltransferase n=2 Tax=Devosia pacifica TaxID=1335967 RepID=A0A918S7P2_9HYPH|nr:putative nicotinate-nucleotide adenylyltransferase [Devosia pacifica]
MRIGLFGGSFNPAHEGHRLVAEQSLQRLRLDALWVLVTPGNPLKSHDDLRPLGERMAATKAIMAHPAITVTDIEAQLGFRYTYETVRFLRRRLFDRRLVWIMGADSMLHFHRWENWQEIAEGLPMAIYVRPGASRLAPTSRAARRYAHYRVAQEDASSLADRSPPAWVYLTGTSSTQSSTAIRNQRQTAT